MAKENTKEQDKHKRSYGFIIAIIFLTGLSITYTYYRQQYIGASDWYGYYSEAQLFRQGRYTLDVAMDPGEFPAVAPISYFVSGDKVLPQYPPGYPLLLALAGIAGLESFVTPLVGVLTALLMFLCLRRLVSPFPAGLLTLLWSLSPIVFWGATHVMSDLVATFFIILTFYLLEGRKTRLSALAFGFSIIVRPTNVLFLFVLLPRLFKQKRWFQFGLGLVAPGCLYAAYNWLLYGAPWRTGYTYLASNISLSHTPHHLLFYLKEILLQFSPVLAILVILGTWKLKKRSLFYWGWFGIFFCFYLLWSAGSSGEWWWIRFLLPALPALFFLAASGVQWLWELAQPRGKRMERVFVILSLLISVGMIAGYIYGKIDHPEQFNPEKAKFYHDVSRIVAEKVPTDSWIGAMSFSGAIRYYSGLNTFNLYDKSAKALAIQLLRRERRPVYLVVEPFRWNLPLFQKLLRRFRWERVCELPPWKDFYLVRLVRVRLRQESVQPQGPAS